MEANYIAVLTLLLVGSLCAMAGNAALDSGEAKAGEILIGIGATCIMLITAFKL